MESLQESINRYNISLPKGQIEQLDSYCRLLWDWNTRLNLTRHTNYDRFVSRDLIDALALAEFLRDKERILDVGSGGGMPGIILKIIRPDLHVELCDSTGKKTLALSEIINDLNLNIPVHHAKAESILAACIAPKNKKFTKQTKSQNQLDQRNQHNQLNQIQEPKPEIARFTTLTIRAVAKLVQLLRMFNPYWTLFDRLLLIKGPKWINERGEARHYNLMNKLALRVLKTYQTETESKQDESTQNESTQDNSKNETKQDITQTTTVNSVVLQICRKDDFEQLDNIIDNHKIISTHIEKSENFKNKNKEYRNRQPFHNKNKSKKITRKKQIRKPL
ncbi:MAG: class I SAM-dependent methyltransferase [Planctomycetaceae bacterium]|jgi:16S rRNA (guanine527-N7)-methyltransferase|nr:class I SAM-dependent methyltransferase [Planctomycetaceae bacterium]